MTKLNQPWIHFLVLGAALFLLRGALFPEPKPAIGPLSDARIDVLIAQWSSDNGRQMPPDQRASLIAAELDRDMLFQRALELEIHLHDGIVRDRLIRNMHFLNLADGLTEADLFDKAIGMRLYLDDEVIKRRLIQVMEDRILADNPPPEPSQAEIAQEFARRSREFRLPPRYSIEQLYFPPERAADLRPISNRISRHNLRIDDVRALGAPFLQGQAFSNLTPDQLAQIFGDAFVRDFELGNPEAQHWIGPIQSVFGSHLVWVNAVEPARDATLADVEVKLRSDLEYAARAKALQCAIIEMRKEYEWRGPDMGTSKVCP